MSRSTSLVSSVVGQALAGGQAMQWFRAGGVVCHLWWVKHLLVARQCSGSEQGVWCVICGGSSTCWWPGNAVVQSRGCGVSSVVGQALAGGQAVQWFRAGGVVCHLWWVKHLLVARQCSSSEQGEWCFSDTSSPSLFFLVTVSLHTILSIWLTLD